MHAKGGMSGLQGAGVKVGSVEFFEPRMVAAGFVPE